MITESSQIDYMEKAGSASQAKGDRYSSNLECGVAATELTLLLTKEEGNDEQINKHQIEKPRSALLQNQPRIESPPPSMKDDDAELTGIDKEELMGFLGKELKKMEEAEKRRREEVLNGTKAMATTPSRVACDMKQEKEMPKPSFPSSQPKPQHKKLKMIGFVGKDQSHSLLPLQLTPPEMPFEIQEAITLLGGTSPVWLAQKTLTKSDVNKDLGRLFIPPCEALEQFLTNEEKNAAWVEQNTTWVEKKKKEEIGLNVILVSPMGDCLEISFRIWGSLKQCVLNKTWRNIIERFDLKRHSDTVQLWCFRLPVERDSKLCFAMNIIKNVQLGDEELLDADQSRKRVTSKRIKPSLDNFEARPLKKHHHIKLNSDEDESPVHVEALPQEEYRAVSAKAEE